MAPDGVRVVEIDLALPGTCYYLHWKPGRAEDSVWDRDALLDNTRNTAGRLGWAVFAVGYNTRVVQLLFQTADGDVNAGLSDLLQNSAGHRLYLVQPETALIPLAHHIHEQADNGPYADLDRERQLPDIHYGLFVGDGDWAKDMLAMLTRRALDASADDREQKALHEITRANIHRHEAILAAYRSGHYNLKDIAEHFGMHFSELSAVINALSTRTEAK